MRLSPTAKFRSKYGDFNLMSFETMRSVEHAAMWIGDLSAATTPLVRIQSACMTSTVLGGVICDCAEQIKLSFQHIVGEGCGLFVYLDEEGRGLGLCEKVAAIAEMNRGANTVTAFTQRGLSPDIRTYESAGIILRKLGVMKSLRLMTNNPRKIDALKMQGFDIVERVAVEVAPTEHTYGYLSVKKSQLGHLLTMV